MNIKQIHEEFMLEAIELATQGMGFVSPNPMVGAIIVKQIKGKYKIIGKGFHRKFGDKHAEIEALTNCIEDPKGAELYVNLEPCCHTGKTDPCTDAIIKAKIKEVFVGIKDPNPLISGNGIKKLEKANIKVHLGILNDKCQKLNEIFSKWIVQKTPFISIKTACTLDGKIALDRGIQTILGGQKSLNRVHKMRKLYDSILIGIDTLIIDNPSLTCRLPGKNIRHPKRIILDSYLKTPLTAKIFQEDGYNIICCLKEVNKDKESEINRKNRSKVLEIEKNKDGHIDLHDLINKLSNENIASILIEGGGTINSAFLNAGLVDKISIIYSPTVSGNKNAASLFENDIINEIKLKNINTFMLDNDVWWEGYL